MRYSDRAALARNEQARRLFTLMDEKETNLAVALDVTNQHDLFAITSEIGEHIAVLKTHIDILSDYDETVPERLMQLAKQHRFLIFEDRKFADIGNTVKHQYRDGLYRMASWSDIVNAHTLPGEGIIEGLKEVGLPLQKGLLLLAEMSSSGNLIDDDYTQATLAMARRHADFCMGFISQGKITDEPHFVHMTPGVSLSSKGDALGQRYNTPEAVIGERQSDVIIVGRAIISATDKKRAAEEYRTAGWDAYLSTATV